MSKLIDSSQSYAIKLFGKTIPLLSLNQEEDLANHELSFSGATTREDCCGRNLISSANSLVGVTVNSNDGVQLQTQDPMENQESNANELLKDELEDSSYNEIREDLKDGTTLSGITENARSDPLAERKSSSLRSSNNSEISETTSSQQEKTLKKPDKILPCPRCNSMETKFCYYNNYNVNQPRHFCKNCQRYWTAGGTMRNVPVGAGRRKTKSSSSLYYHHVMISEAIRAAQASAANGINRNPSCENNNSPVLTFGSDSSIPIASAFNHSAKTHNNVQNGIQKPEQIILVEDNHLDESLFTTSYSLQKGGKSSLNQSEDKNSQLCPSKVPSFARPCWPFPWGSIQWNTVMIPPPSTVNAPCFPVSFNSAPAYGNYSVACPWDVPVDSPVNQSAPSSIPISPTLGKHSRDENILNAANLEKKKPSGESDKSEGRALNSKTLRIDDPGETAKTSMLATLVIKSKMTNNSINSGGLFDGFQSKSNDEGNNRVDRFSVLRANPAALSRSLNFQENT